MVRPARAPWPFLSGEQPDSTESAPAAASPGGADAFGVKQGRPGAGPGSPREVRPAVFRCLYCDLDKPDSESTLEHAIPQFLGGAHAPMHYKLRNVCKRCNNVLGLHVDASFARTWTVTNGLAMAARKLYTGSGDVPLPLVCIGVIQDIPGLVAPAGMAAEYWAGPSGENIVWIRSDSDVMYWYSGGNPIDKKTKPSTLYYLPTATDPVAFEIGIAAFNEAFKKAKARRIFGAELVGVPAGTLYPGFDAPTDEERTNLKAIRRACMNGAIHARARFNVRFDHRFICKMVLAVGYSLFGEPFLGTDTAKQARLGLWPKPDQEPELRGVGSLGGQVDAAFSSLTGYPGAVAVMVLRVGQHYGMTVNVDQRMPFTTELAPATLQSPHINSEHGYALLLFPQLRLPVELELPTLLAHQFGNMSYPELAGVDATAEQAKAFDQSLPPLPTRPPSPPEDPPQS